MCAYEGLELPADKVSTVSIYKLGEVTLEDLEFDGKQVPILATNVKLAPGKHQFKINYSLEDWPDCDHASWFCLPDIEKVECTGEI